MCQLVDRHHHWTAGHFADLFSNRISWNGKEYPGAVANIEAVWVLAEAFSYPSVRSGKGMRNFLWCEQIFVNGKSPQYIFDSFGEICFRNDSECHAQFRGLRNRHHRPFGEAESRRFSDFLFDTLLHTIFLSDRSSRSTVIVLRFAGGAKWTVAGFSRRNCRRTWQICYHFYRGLFKP